MPNCLIPSFVQLHFRHLHQANVMPLKLKSQSSLTCWFQSSQCLFIFSAPSHPTKTKTKSTGFDTGTSTNLYHEGLEAYWFTRNCRPSHLQKQYQTWKQIKIHSLHSSFANFKVVHKIPAPVNTTKRAVKFFFQNRIIGAEDGLISKTLQHGKVRSLDLQYPETRLARTICFQHTLRLVSI